MKKLFTILAATLFCTGLWADEATLVLNNGATSTPSNFFTVAKGTDDPNYNSNYTGVYDGVTYKKGLKIETATTVTFTTDVAATITVVQSTAKNEDKTIKFDGEAMTDGKTDVEGTTTCKVYTLSNVAAGDHTISRGSGEAGLLYVKVEWEGSNPTCKAPTITIDQTWSEENSGFKVTLTNNEEGATLTYSVNDDDFQAYTAAFYVPSKAKVVAKASKEGYIAKTATATAPLHILVRNLEKDTLLLAAGDTVDEKMKVVAPHITLIFNDAAWQNENKATGDAGFDSETGYVAFVAGQTNPSVKDNVPTAGCFYTLQPSADGTLEFGVKIGKGKKFYVSEDGSLLSVKINDETFTSGSSFSANTYGQVVLDVKKNANYYVWCEGSKVAFFGFKYKEKGGGTALDNAEVTEKALKVIENGQMFIIKNGVKYNAQGAVVK